MCSIADFWPRIGRIPLVIGPDLGEAVLCRTADGAIPVRVTKPEYFNTDVDREAHLRHLEIFYGVSRN